MELKKIEKINEIADSLERSIQLLTFVKTK